MKCKIKQGNLKISLPIILIFIFLLFFPHYISAQYTDLKFKNYTRENGLYETQILSVLQDREGFLWFGTNSSGLYRFDGYNFKAYYNVTGRKSSLVYSWINCLYEDRNGIIWIGTSDEGLSRFDKTTEQFINFTHNPYETNSISGNTVQSLFMDRDGYLWVGCLSEGLNKYDEKNNRFIHYQNNVNDSSSLVNNTVWSILEDRSGNLWIGTNNGLDRFDREKEIFIHYNNIPDKHANVKKSNTIQCIYEDKDGIIWLGTENGLNKFTYTDEKNFSFKTYYFNKNKIGTIISSIYCDTNRMFWIGTGREGLYIFNPATEKFNNFRKNSDETESLISDIINRRCIIEDKSGNIWIGTIEGISMNDKKRFSLYSFSKGTSQYAFFANDKKNLLLASKNNFHTRDTNGVFKVIPYEFPDKTENSQSLHYFYAGICDKSGVIWFGCLNSLFRYNRATEKLNHFYSFPDIDYEYFIRGVFEDSDSLLWIGTGNGLRVFNKERTNFEKFVHNDNDSFSIGSNNVSIHIYEDTKGGIWIPLQRQGVDKYDKKTGKFHHYRNNPSDSNSLSSDLVCSLYDDGKGSIWIAACNGLDKLNTETNTFTHYTEKDGLADNNTLYILPDNSGNLWISTNSGISKFNPVTCTFWNFDRSDGVLEINTDRGYKTSNGELFFGSAGNAITYFFPDSIKENKHIPPIVITSFKIFNKEVVLDKSITKTDEINLTYKENFFSIEFSALEFTNPSKNQYAYILEGVDKEWIYSKNVRTAHYTNISPGEYTFRVKGSNNDGVWNEEGTFIKIIITPPFWATWWFRTIAIILILGAAVFAVKLRFKALKNEKKMQEDFTRQIISAHEEERKRISGELHDSLGQNLLIIKNKSLMCKKHPERNPEIVEDICDLSASTLQEVRDISYNLYPYQLERLGLTKAIESITEKALKSSNIEFKDELETIDNIFNPEEEINIFRVIQECVNNIIKHSDATKAELTIKKTGNDILITIKDNGKGFDVKSVLSDKLKCGIGIIDIYERAKLFKGTVEFKSAPGKGTKCKITIPLIDEKKLF